MWGRAKTIRVLPVIVYQLPLCLVEFPGSLGCPSSGKVILVRQSIRVVETTCLYTQMSDYRG